MTLILAAILGIAAIVLLIVWLKVHPFLALLIGAAVTALVAGVPYTQLLDSFAEGVGQTIGKNTGSAVGILIVLGGVIGTLLLKSGGADVIVDTITSRTSQRVLPWAMALVAFIVGIPMFFEIGVVILIPVVMMIAKRTKQPVILLGIPALAGLSALHAFIPPHPGPLAAIDNLHSSIGLTLGLGLLVAIPSIVIAGPFLGHYMAKWVPIQATGALLDIADEGTEQLNDQGKPVTKPSFGSSITVILLPVVLMLLATVLELTGANRSSVGAFVAFLGTPLIALIITTVVGIFVLGLAQGHSAKEINGYFGKAIESIGGILLIVAAGGGFKQTLVDSGVNKVIADGISSSHMSPLLAAYLVAVLIRLATGSATVATVTASGLMTSLATGMSPAHLALMVLAIGAGSIFLSHVNDAGFWLVKEYFGLSVKQTFMTWSLMETVLSAVGFVFVFLLSLVIA